MTQGIEATDGDAAGRHRAARLRASGLAEWWLWLGVSAVARRGRGVPPPPADGVAAARGRDARALRRPRFAPRRRRARHPRARRRAAPLPRRVGGRAPRLRARRPAAHLRRLRAREPAARRRCSARGSRDGASRSPQPRSSPRSWLFLFHGVYGRMYSLFLFCSLLCTLALLAALERGGRGRWALWVVAALLTVAAHPYGVLLLAGQGAYVLAVTAGPAPARRCSRARPCSSLGIPFWLTDLVLADRFEVGVGGGGEKLGGPRRVRALLLALRGDATAGWWPVTLAVLAAAAGRRLAPPAGAGARALPRAASRSPRSCSRELGGSASPESRHLIFLAPLLAIAVAARLVRVARRTPTVAVAWRRRSCSSWRSPGPGSGRRRCSSGSPTRARRRAPRRRAGSPRRAARRRPLRLRAALSRRVGAQPLVPDDRRPARRRPARAADDRAGRAPLGRGVWVLDASERNNIRPSARDRASPADPGAAVRGARVRAVPRAAHRRARRSRPKAFLYYARPGAARRPAARDRRRGRQHPDGRARGAGAPGLRAVPALPLEQLAVARRALEGAEARLHGAPATPGATESRRDGRGADDARRARTTACAPGADASLGSSSLAMRRS